MQDFIDHKTNVLVCTTILESGIDIPNANTIIIENADRFGLAQLYQIRGRVGRSNKKAYAYITYRKNKNLSEDAEKRLKAIKEFTEFGSGFKIAARDLQIRGAGSIFGEVQSGHIEQVGFDMYNKLLKEVIDEEKGIKEEENKDDDIQIDLKITGYIPDKYIQDEAQKIEVYQDIASCTSNEDIEKIRKDLIDRFGKIPQETLNLLQIAKIKILCKNKKVNKIKQINNRITFYFDDFDNSKIDELLRFYKGNIRFSEGDKPAISVIIGTLEDSIKKTKEFLNKI